MSDSPSALPPRASLEQLRKQAKERRDATPGATLADAQFALARDHGFDSWPKLVHHVEALARPEVAQQDRIARDMVDVCRHRDEAAAARLNDLFHSGLDVDQIRRFVEQRLFPLPGGPERFAQFGIADARLLVAGLYGFPDWDTFVLQADAGAGGVSGPGLSSTPPFYRIDQARGIIEPRQPMSARDWETLIGVMRERGLTGLDAHNLMDDDALAKLAALEDLTVLKLHGSDRLTDAGLQHLARITSLEEIELGGWKSPMTDAGFAALRGLPRLRVVRSQWSRHITDGGVRDTLTPCPRLEDANFMGTPTGDGLIGALADKPGVSRLFCGTTVTDAGLARLPSFPRFRRWQGGTPEYSLLEFDAGPTYLAIKGPFTPAGLDSLQALDGVFALNLHWLSEEVTSLDLSRLQKMANLGFLAIDGDLCDDEAMRQIGRLPRLRMLLAQQPAAGDDGFTALSASRTLEYIWGRECPHLTGRGFAALAAAPCLKGIAVSCKFVEDRALAMLPRFPALRALMPMDVADEGFRHVGRCEGLEELWCMYCRDTGDRATEHVAGLRLKTYYAGSTRITDRSLDILSRITSLERVELQSCQHVTNKGVGRLAALPNLRQLQVESCRNVTRAGVSGFAPPVRVSYSSV
jgi:hypothetical protein